MFEFLNNSPVTDVLPAAHHALQFVRQWAAAGNPESLTDLSPEQMDIATQIREEIEIREEVSIAQLSQLKVAEYIKMISDQMQKVARQEFQVDKKKGQRLLNELRSGKK